MFGISHNNITVPKDNQPKLWGIFTTDRWFYQTFFSLLVVVALQRLAALSVNLVDNVMLGLYTELALSAANIVNQLQYMLQMTAGGIGAGIMVLAAQYWGQGRIEPIKKIISIGLKLALAIGCIFFFIAKLFPYELISLFTNDADIIKECISYLDIVCWTYLIFVISNSLVTALQSIQSAMIGTIMSLNTVIVNAILNYFLIFGNGCFEAMGIRGAAIATLCSRTMELMIVLVYLRCIDRKLHMKLVELVRFDITYLRDFIHVSTPVVVTGALWGIGLLAQTAVLGHISKTVIAANSIATVVWQVLSVFGMACANTSSVTIGKTIGAGRLMMLRTYTKTLQAIFLIIGVLTSLVMFLSIDFVLSLYNISSEAKELTRSFLLVLCITDIGSCYEFPVEGGIIAGGGSTAYQAWIDNLFMWLFTIPLASLCAFAWNFPPVVTFCALKADQVLKCIPNGIVCNHYRWAKILTTSQNENTLEK